MNNVRGKFSFSEPDIYMHEIKPNFLIVILVQHLSWNPTKKESYDTCCQWPTALFVKDKLSVHRCNLSEMTIVNGKETKMANFS